MPVCEFRIDSDGIERLARQEHTAWGWNEVLAAQRCRHGYLLVHRGGAIPIPDRCLTAGQQAGLRAFIAEHVR